MVGDAGKGAQVQSTRVFLGIFASSFLLLFSGVVRHAFFLFVSEEIKDEVEGYLEFAKNRDLNF